LAAATALSAHDVQRACGLDDDIRARLETYLALLARWQRRINLVAASTLADPWRRHILDSAQLAPLVPTDAAEVVDLGSGAGFPGLVVAIAGRRSVRLVEADARKCAFLAEAARVTGAEAVVDNRRIESIPAASADVITVRALAPLPVLLPLAARVLRPAGMALLLKGATVAAELTAVEKTWTMRVTHIASSSQPSGVILKIERLRRA
jgi:16S rRNA (guanine527-N7)-methyltransferase